MRIRIIDSGPGWARVTTPTGRVLTLTGFPGQAQVLTPGTGHFDWRHRPPLLRDLVGTVLEVDPLQVQVQDPTFLAHTLWEGSGYRPDQLSRACALAGAEEWEVVLLDQCLSGSQKSRLDYFRERREQK